MGNSFVTFASKWPFFKVWALITRRWIAVCQFKPVYSLPITLFYVVSKFQAPMSSAFWDMTTVTYATLIWPVFRVWNRNSFRTISKFFEIAQIHSYSSRKNYRECLTTFYLEIGQIFFALHNFQNVTFATVTFKRFFTSFSDLTFRYSIMFLQSLAMSMQDFRPRYALERLV